MELEFIKLQTYLQIVGVIFKIEYHGNNYYKWLYIFCNRSCDVQNISDNACFKLENNIYNWASLMQNAFTEEEGLAYPFFYPQS